MLFEQIPFDSRTFVRGYSCAEKERKANLVTLHEALIILDEKRDVCKFHLQQKNTKNRVSTKELDWKIEGTYLIELSLEEDVPTNAIAQSTHRLVLKH